MESSKISGNQNSLLTDINENESSAAEIKNKNRSDFSDMVSTMAAFITQSDFDKKGNSFQNDTNLNGGNLPDDFNSEKELLKNDKTTLESIKKRIKQKSVSTKNIESKYSLLKDRDTSTINNTAVLLDDTLSKDTKTEMTVSKEKIIELSTPVSKENIEKIESMLQSRLESVRRGESVEVKIALKPEELGRVVIKAFYDLTTSKITVEMTGKNEAIELFTKNAAVMSEGLKSSGIDFTGFSFKKENDKNENEKEKKESKNKKYSKESKNRSMLMEA